MHPSHHTMEFTVLILTLDAVCLYFRECLLFRKKKCDGNDKEAQESNRKFSCELFKESCMIGRLDSSISLCRRISNDLMKINSSYFGKLIETGLCVCVATDHTSLSGD